jgi:Sortase domain
VRYVLSGLGLIMAGVVGLLVFQGGQRPPPAPVITAVPLPAVTWPAVTPPPQVAVPVALTIPAIGVDTPLIDLGRTSSGALQVPDSFTVAGWYDLGPRPGQPGPAVIAGHVDSTLGPAVFYLLGELRAGDQVYVRRADGSVAAFVVTGVLMYTKTAFPASSVYGPVSGPQLRLITCGGTFDYARHSYLSNVVVYATEVPGLSRAGVLVAGQIRALTRDISGRRRGSRAGGDVRAR